VDVYCGVYLEWCIWTDDPVLSKILRPWHSCGQLLSCPTQMAFCPLKLVLVHGWVLPALISLLAAVPP
jgi:hypothetical protein